MTPNRAVAEGEAVSAGAGRLSAALALVGAVGLFAAMGALVRLVSGRYALGEIIFYRGFFATLVLLALAPGQGGWQVLRTSRPLGHALRSLAGLTAMALSFAALALLPLAEATALGFTAPLLTAALAVPLLGERVTRQRWLALLLGLAGVLVIVRPGTATFSWGTLLGVAGAAFIALAMISIRRLPDRAGTGTGRAGRRAGSTGAALPAERGGVAGGNRCQGLEASTGRQHHRVAGVGAGLGSGATRPDGVLSAPCKGLYSQLN